MTTPPTSAEMTWRQTVAALRAEMQTAVGMARHQVQRRLDEALAYGRQQGWTDQDPRRPAWAQRAIAGQLPAQVHQKVYR